MKKHHVMSLGEADIFFAEQGAVGFFDAFFPKSHWQEEPKIFRRHYFDLEDRYLGNFIPALWNLGTHVSLKVFDEVRADWRKHPRLTQLARELK